MLPDEVIMDKIYLIRGQKVMLDHDLATLYEVETRRLNEQVKRNPDRFPENFYVSAYERRIRKFEVAIRDIKMGWP